MKIPHVIRSRVALALALQSACLLVLLSFGTGCGAISAMANPKVGWALNDPAPMSVVVRRVDSAEATANEVDRLLVSTPANADSEWLGKTAPPKDAAAAEMKALLEDPQYKTSHARVVAAEVWSRMLGDLKSDAASGAPPNVLTLVSAELGEKYARVMEKKRAIGRVRAQIAAEEEAKDADKKRGATDAEKKERKTKIEELEKQAKALEKEVEPLQKEFLASAKALAAKASPEVRAKVGPALVNLRQAVDDAEIANGAAAVRYPLAMSGIVGSLKEMVPVFIADIIEEQTGKRPKMQGLQPDVALEGTDVKLTINGMSKDDLGKIKMDDLTIETARRAKNWVGRVATLLGAVASNKETLSFEADALDAVIGGFASAGWTKTAAATIPAGDAREVLAATAREPRQRKAPDTAVASAKPATPSKPTPDKTAVAAAAKTPANASDATKPAAAPARSPAKDVAPKAAERLKDDRAFAMRAGVRSIATLQNELVNLTAARDRASKEDKAAALLKVAEAYMELDYAATYAGSSAMADTARLEAIAAYEQIRSGYATSVDETLLYHLAIAYDRDGNDAMEQKTLSELKRRFPASKLASRTDG